MGGGKRAAEAAKATRMGKHDTRRCRAGATAAARMQARVVVGVRTRSALAAKRRKKAAAVAAAKRMASRAEKVSDLLGRGGGDGQAAGCYLHLRSRRLYFMAAKLAVPRAPLVGTAPEAPLPRAAGLPVEEGVAGIAISRSASTASSVDVGSRERSQRTGGAAEAGDEDRNVESSVSDSGWERMETTPSSRPPGDSSDTESSHAGGDEEQKRLRRSRSLPFRARARTSSIRMPPASEIDEFFAAAERAEVERFAAKYNFDVVRGVPLGAGRFEWRTVGSG